MKVQTKVFLSRDLSLSLDAAARRMRRSKSEIMQAALASFLSADNDEAREAAVARRLADPMAEIADPFGPTARRTRDLGTLTEAIRGLHRLG